jgi:hypothetical protein
VTLVDALLLEASSRRSTRRLDESESSRSARQQVLVTLVDVVGGFIVSPQGYWTNHNRHNQSVPVSKLLVNLPNMRTSCRWYALADRHECPHIHHEVPVRYHRTPFKNSCPVLFRMPVISLTFCDILWFSYVGCSTKATVLTRWLGYLG